MNEAEGEAGIQKRLRVSSERNRALLKGQEAGYGNVLLLAVGGGRWRQLGLDSQLEATLRYMSPYLKKKKKKRGGTIPMKTPGQVTQSESPLPLPHFCARKVQAVLERSTQPSVHSQMGSSPHPSPILLGCSGTPGSECHPCPHPLQRGVAGGQRMGPPGHALPHCSLPLHSHCGAPCSSAGHCEEHVKKEAPREVRTTPEQQQGAAKR